MSAEAFLLGYLEKSAGDLDTLKTLKAESDRGNYSEKQRLFRMIYRQDPESFEVDSSKDGIVGLTHKKTGFRFHMKAEVVPQEIQKEAGGVADVNAQYAFVLGYVEKEAALRVSAAAKGLLGMLNKYRQRVLTPLFRAAPEDVQRTRELLRSRGLSDNDLDRVFDPHFNSPAGFSLHSADPVIQGRQDYRQYVTDYLRSHGRLPDNIGPHVVRKHIAEAGRRSDVAAELPGGNAYYNRMDHKISAHLTPSLLQALDSSDRAATGATGILAHEVAHSVHYPKSLATNISTPLYETSVAKTKPMVDRLAPSELRAGLSYDQRNAPGAFANVGMPLETVRTNMRMAYIVAKHLAARKAIQQLQQAGHLSTTGAIKSLEGVELGTLRGRIPGGAASPYRWNINNQTHHHYPTSPDYDRLGNELLPSLETIKTPDAAATAATVVNSSDPVRALLQHYREYRNGWRVRQAAERGPVGPETIADALAKDALNWMPANVRNYAQKKALYEERLRKATWKKAWRVAGGPLPSASAPQS
jgi:hypothetical protein